MQPLTPYDNCYCNVYLKDDDYFTLEKTDMRLSKGFYNVIIRGDTTEMTTQQIYDKLLNGYKVKLEFPSRAGI